VGAAAVAARALQVAIETTWNPLASESIDPQRRRTVMTLGLAFWILMLIWLVFGLVVWSGNAGPYGPVGSTLLLFMLFLLLGWHVFGAPLHG
jgi:hypothetical protein